MRAKYKFDVNNLDAQLNVTYFFTINDLCKPKRGIKSWNFVT